MHFFLFLILLLSVIQIIFPAQMLMFGRRWQFKEGVEPSDAAILLSRISAIIAILVILFVLFIG